MPLLRILLLLTLGAGLLTGCNQSGPKNRLASAAPAPLAPPPAATPAVLAAPAAAPAGRFVSFTWALDRRIEAAYERARPIMDSLARFQPDYEAQRRCDLGETINDLLGAKNEEFDLIQPYVCDRWSPWLTDYCLLTAFLADSARVLAPGPREEPPSRYPQPVRLPSRSGRQLYLAGEQQIALLEFRPDGAFRGMMLGHANSFGGVEHQLYPHPDAELLVLTTTHGNMGAGRCASGESATYLQIYDLLQDQWLLNERVARSETRLGGCEDENGEQAGGSDWEEARRYAVRDQGRTLRFGPYTSSGDGPTIYPDADTAANALAEMADGTYRLRQARYQRAGR